MFRNIRISFKLLLSTIVFIFPVSVLLYFVINGFDNDINRSEKEKKGNLALGSIYTLTNDIIEFHNIINKNQFRDSTDNLLQTNSNSNIVDRIDLLFEKMLLKNKVFSEQLGSLAKSDDNLNQSDFSPAELQRLWVEIRSSNGKIHSEEVNKLFEAFYQKALLLNRFIANESGLILDPDLDSYYLMDISVLVMPKMQIEIGKIINIICSSYSTGMIQEYDVNKVKLILDILYEENVQRIEQGISTSIREDKNFYNSSNSLEKNMNSNLSEFRNSLDNFRSLVKKWYSGDSELSDEQLYNSLYQAGNIALNNSDKFWIAVNKELDIQLDLRIAHFIFVRNVAVLSSVFALIVAIFFVLMVSRQIAKHLGIVTNIAVSIANGNIDDAVYDLQHGERLGSFRKYSDENLKVRDEILTLFKAIRKMTFNLSSLLTQVSKSGNLVSESTFTITSSAHDIEATVAQQAALTNQVNSTSNEISKTAYELANTMNFITESFNNNAAMLMTGLLKLNEIKSNIVNLYNSTGEISEKLSIIKEKASGINIVITTITKVANQTNLVSLNASIEAERAGVYGSGFAVVAREIRRLADQTSIAALNIEDMINDMQIAVDAGGETIINYMLNTKNGTENTSQIIDQISGLIDKTNELPDKIFSANMAMKQQSESAQQINESMKQLNTAAIQTRNTIIEFNNTTEKLNTAVKGLTDELNKFSIK